MKSSIAYTLVAAFAVTGSLFSTLSAAENTPKVIFSAHVEGKDPTGFGVFVRDALETTLTDNESIILIDRKKISTSLSETATSELSSTTTNSQLNVAGANFAVYPKITTFKKNTIFTYKVVDLSTTSYRSAMVRATEDSDPLEIVESSAAKIIAAIEKLSKSELSLAQSSTKAQWKLAKDKPRFTIALRIPEASANQQNPDPAGEKELSSTLLANNFTIKQLSRPSQATSVQNALHLEGKEHEALINECRSKKIEILIIGLASSDNATRIGSYHIGRARIELTAVRVSDSKVLASAKGYGKSSDLSNMVAEKKAIEDAVQRLAPKFIEDFVSQ